MKSAIRFSIFLDHQKDYDVPTSVSFTSQKSSWFLFYSHVQVLVSAVHKPEQRWSVESFSTFAMLKQWPSTQKHILKFHSLNDKQIFC